VTVRDVPPSPSPASLGASGAKPPSCSHEERTRYGFPFCPWCGASIKNPEPPDVPAPGKEGRASPDRCPRFEAGGGVEAPAGPENPQHEALATAIVRDLCETEPAEDGDDLLRVTVDDVRGAVVRALEHAAEPRCECGRTAFETGRERCAWCFRPAPRGKNPHRHRLGAAVNCDACAWERVFGRAPGEPAHVSRSRE
jgi:hypothetical protein